MNKLVRGLLLTALAMSGANAADSPTNKTFMAGRPVGVNLPMEYTKWHTQIHKEEGDDTFAAALQATGFYQENTNEDDLGRYFGFNGLREIAIGTAGTAMTTVDDGLPRSGINFDRKHLFHDNGATRDAALQYSLTGTLFLSYKHEAGGVRFDYQQDFDAHKKGGYLKISAPLVWQKDRVRLGLAGHTSGTTGLEGATTYVNNYFDGTYSPSGVPRTGETNIQDPLRFAKIGGEHGTFDIADVDVQLGWSFKETENTHAAFNVAMTIPFSQRPNGEYLSSNQSGNRSHWAFGGGFDGKFKLWTDDSDSCLELMAVVNWRYLLPTWEVRTPGLRDKQWGQYFLLGEDGSRGVMPAANVITGPITIYPGNQLDAIVGFAYNYGGLTADLGYNLYYREAEGARIKDNEYLTELRFGLAGNNYSAAGDFDTSTDSAYYGEVQAGVSQASAANAEGIGRANIDLKAVETPEQITHKVYGGVGYSFDDMENPVMLGLGGSYEFASDRKALETWAAWFKVGMKF